MGEYDDSEQAVEPSALERAFVAVIDDEVATVLVDVHGPASERAAVITDALAQIDGAGERVWILRGRCGDGCFNAFAEIVEACASLLTTQEITVAPPVHTGALLRAFPVLASAPSLAGQPPPPPATEPYELRRQAFEALRELLLALSQQRPLLLWLADLERGDLDSLALLRVLEPRGEDGDGDIRMLMILAYGELPEDGEDPQAQVASTDGPGDRGQMATWLRARQELDGGDLIELVIEAEATADATESSGSASATAGFEAEIAAGDQAHARLAFARAAAHYQAALQRFAALHPDAQHPNLRVKLGSALADLGERREAAGHLIAAARMLGSAKTNAQVRGLELQAASLYIADGALAAGWKVLESLLRAFAEQAPTSAAEALLRANWRRGRFLLRRRELEQIHEPPSAHEQARLDLLWFISTRLGVVSRSLADALRTKHLEEVVRLGDDSDRVRALAYEVAVESHIGTPFDKLAKRLLEVCGRLSRRSGAPLDEAWRLCAVAAQEFCHGRWRLCAEACEAADAILRKHSNVGWERSMVASYHWFALAWLGELARLRPLLREAAALADERDEPFNQLEIYAGQPVLSWLAADRPELARDKAEAAMRRITPPAGSTWPVASYRRQHYCDLVALTHASLYRGDATPAWAALQAQWRDLEVGYFTTMRTVGLELLHARARAALALLEQLQRDPELTAARLIALPGGSERDQASPAHLLADVRRQLETIRDDEACFAPPIARLLEAGAHNLEGKPAEARRLLDEAVRGFAAVDMALHRECARMALGERIGGSEGAALQARAAQWMRDQGVVDPRRLAASQAPGFGLID